MITHENIVRHELIGLKVKIVDSTNKKDIGLEGIVIDETRNTILIESKRKEKKLIKENCVFSFRLGREWVDVDGKIIVARPEDRIKKRFRKW